MCDLCAGCSPASLPQGMFPDPYHLTLSGQWNPCRVNGNDHSLHRKSEPHDRERMTVLLAMVEENSLPKLSPLNNESVPVPGDSSAARLAAAQPPLAPLSAAWSIARSPARPPSYSLIHTPLSLSTRHLHIGWTEQVDIAKGPSTLWT